MPETRTITEIKNGSETVIGTYIVPDAQLDREQGPGRIANQYAGLRTWSSDAATTSTPATWAAMTAAQKTEAQRVTIQRFGILCDRLADLLTVLNMDGR